MTLERRLTWVALAATSVLLMVLVGSGPTVIRAMASNADCVSSRSALSPSSASTSATG